MGNQCCSAVRYTEEQFNEMQNQKFRGGQMDQPYTRTIDQYTITCGQNRVIIKSNGVNIITDKPLYDILLIVHDLFSIIEEQNHQFYVTENLMSFFRNNPKQITNRIVADSLAELLSEQYTNTKIMLLIEENKSSNQNSNNRINNNSQQQQFHPRGNSISSLNDPNFTRNQLQYNNNPAKQQYASFSDVEQHGLPVYQTAYKDNSPIQNLNSLAQFPSYTSPKGQTKDKIVDYEPNPSLTNGQYDMQQQNNNNRINNTEEAQSNNYANRVFNNPNTIYKSGFQSPSKEQYDDNQFQTNNNNNNNYINSSAVKQLGLTSTSRQGPDQNIIEVIEFIVSRMGTHQLEQTSQKDIWQIWRVFDPITGYMNFHKKYNLLQFGKSAMEIYQKEATVLQKIEEAQINVAPLLMKYDAKNKEIKFEGGVCTLWELLIEMSKVQLRFTEKDLIYILCELVRMIKELEKLNIYHGNIKPQNIVLFLTAESKYQIRLINFENSTNKPKEKYPNAKTENYYDIIHKIKIQSDPMSSQIYQIGRTILNLIAKLGTKNNNLHYRKNHPLITQETLMIYANEYPKVISIIQKMLRINVTPQVNNNQGAISKTAGNGLSDRNKDDQQPVSNESILNQFSIPYTIQQLDRDLSQLINNTNNRNNNNNNSNYNSNNNSYGNNNGQINMNNNQFQNYIYDPQQLVKQITRRRVQMGAWDHSMTPDIFKREVLYILSLGQFERGCELCNYLLNFKQSPNYNLLQNNGKQSPTTATSTPLQNIQNTQNMQNSGFYSAKGQTSPENNQLFPTNPMPNYQYLKNPVTTPLKTDINKYTGYQHEFLFKAQIVLKQLYSKQLPEIIQAYFHTKEELSLYFFTNNLMKEAIAEQESLINEKKNLIENDPIGLSKSYRILGEFYIRSNKLDLAVKYLQLSLNINNSVHTNLLHIDTAEILISMSEVYSQQNDQKRAIQSAILSYEISSQTSPNSLSFAEICIQISQIFIRVYQDPNKAIPYLEKGIKIKLDCFKQTFLNLFLDINILQLASFYESTKNYAMALEYYQILLDIRLTRLPHNSNLSSPVAQAYTLIGFVLEKINQIDQAQANHIKALTIRKKLYGEVHIEVADSLINLSMSHLRKNQFQESLSLQEQALKIKEKLMPETQDVAQCMNNLAIILETLGNFQEAISYHQKSIAIKKKILGEENSSMATSYNNLALTYKNSGQHEKAIPLLNNALSIRSKADPNSEEVLSVLTNLLAIHTDLGHQDQIKQYSEQINSIQNFLQQKKEFSNKSQIQDEYRISNQPQFNYLNQSNLPNNYSHVNNYNNTNNLIQNNSNSVIQNNNSNSVIQNNNNINNSYYNNAQNNNSQFNNNNQDNLNASYYNNNNNNNQNNFNNINNNNNFNSNINNGSHLNNNSIHNSNDNNLNNKSIINNNQHSSITPQFNNTQNSTLQNGNQQQNGVMNQTAGQSQLMGNSQINNRGQQSGQINNFANQIGNDQNNNNNNFMNKSGQQSQGIQNNNQSNSQVNNTQIKDFQNQKSSIQNQSSQINNFGNSTYNNQQQSNNLNQGQQSQAIQNNNQNISQGNNTQIKDFQNQKSSIQNQSSQINNFGNSTYNNQQQSSNLNQGQQSQAIQNNNQSNSQGNNTQIKDFQNQKSSIQHQSSQINNFGNSTYNNQQQANNLNQSMNNHQNNSNANYSQNKNIFIPDSSNNNQNIQNSIQNNQMMMGDRNNNSNFQQQQQQQQQQNGSTIGNTNMNNPLGLNDNLKNSNFNSYQNNRPTQLNGNFDSNPNNFRAQ